MATAWKKPRFILLEKWNLHMIDNLQIAVPAFPNYMLTSFLVDEILQPRYVDQLISEACHLHR